MTDTTTNGQLFDIKVDSILTNVSNHRLREDAERIAELAKSIDTHGLQQPIRVYQICESSKVTLGFGFRRLEAFKLLKRDRIPAWVFPPAEEQEIRCAQAVENLHREDLTPLEEATACEAIVQTLIDHAHGDTDADVVGPCAAMIGRPRKWVEHRLALLRLSPRVRQMLMDGGIYLGHAQVIAQLAGYEDQEEVAGRVMARPVGQWERGRVKGDMRPPSSVTDARSLVQQRMRTLEKVPWRLDVEFAGKLACSACPENSANAPGLFDGDVPKKATCLNAACYAVKAKQAQSAVQRASNTLAKMDGVKPTPAGAKKAMAERGVEFIQPRIVAEVAKRKQQPKQATPAEKKGTKQASTKARDDFAVRQKYAKALRDWEDRTEQHIDTWIKADSTRAAILILLGATESWSHASRLGHRCWATSSAKKKIAAGWQRLEPLLLAAVRSGDNSVELAGVLHDVIDFLAGDLPEWRTRDLLDGMMTHVAAVIPGTIEAAGPAPKLEDFTKPEASPAKKKATSTTKKKKSKKRKAVPACA
jgi:ParB/RepB/Spo0J family partition protein